AVFGSPCLFTQANQTRLQHRGAPRMPFVAVALGLMGISMSGYSSCQLTLHYRPANHLFKGAGRMAAPGQPPWDLNRTTAWVYLLPLHFDHSTVTLSLDQRIMRGRAVYLGTDDQGP
uniref:Uncharacterized protein n=1 Tax=Gadus morhua TaxID=8049 RepID=A0A8C5AYI6_GADMO